MKEEKIPIDGRKKFKVGRHIAVGFLFDMSTGEQSQSVSRIEGEVTWNGLMMRKRGALPCVFCGGILSINFFARVYCSAH